MSNTAILIKCFFIYFFKQFYIRAKLSTKYNIFHAPALTKKFIDTLGAGDAYFAISSLFVINKEDPDLILLSGNMAGSLKISYLGHEKYLNKDRFYSYFKSLIS